MDKLKWLQEIVEKNENDAQSLYWLAIEYENQKAYSDALNILSKGLSIEEHDHKEEMLEAIKRISSKIQNERVEEEVPVHEVQMIYPPLTVIEGTKHESVLTFNNDEKVTFKDVAGLSQLKKTIQMKIITPFFNKGLFQKFRKKAGGGVLLYGPPGCGKTYIARATAGECDVNFINIKITDILDPYIGVSEQKLSAFFEEARETKPSLIFIDELDAIGFNRSKSSSYLRPLVDTFLNELDGVDSSNEDILIIAATNLPWDVDPALKRSGRFDRTIFVAPPDEEARKEIFHLKLNGRPLGVIDYQLLANKTAFFSGADIENVCDQAAEHILSEIIETGNERNIETNDLIQALTEVQPTTLDWLRTVKNYIKYANQTGMYDEVQKYLRKHKKNN
jgi:SpoVK/Ycf46/Vps4 family AAA+-type ATPase